MVTVNPKIKFCARCGAKLDKSAQFCPSCGNKAATGGTVKPKKNIWKILLYLAAGAVGSSGYGLLFGENPTPGKLLAGQLSVSVFILLVAFLAIRRAMSLIRTGAKVKMAGAFVMLAVVAYVTGTSLSAVYYSQHIFTARSANLINNYMTDAYMAAYGGSMAPDGISKIAGFERITADKLKDLQVPSSLKDYRDKAAGWAGTLADAKTAEAWRAATALPEYRVKTDAIGRRYLFNEALGRLVDVKAFTDSALAAKDSSVEGVGFMFGRLEVTRHFLASLDPDKSLCSASRHAEKICAADVVGHLQQMSGGLAAFMNTNGASQGDWATASAGLNALLDNGGYIPGTTVTGTSEEVRGKTVPASVDGFWTKCKEVSGSALKTSVKSGLPTIEGGYSCYHTVRNSTCWEFLTYSGRDFGGGGLGCTRRNLPQGKALPEHPNFDGTYMLTTNGAACSTGEAIDLAAQAGEVAVKNNVVDTKTSGQIELRNDGMGGVMWKANDNSYTTELNMGFDGYGTMQGAWKLNTAQGNCGGGFTGIKRAD